jgi:hypothetical protein
VPATASPDRAQLELWLKASKTDFNLCHHCEGLHLQALRSVEGVIDSRLFVERYGLLLTTELEIRPMAILPLSADISRLNMDYPTLKVFLDIGDETAPQLVSAGVMLTGEGVTQAQFESFVEMTLEETRQLAAACLQLDYLFPEPDRDRPDSSPALH